MSEIKAYDMGRFQRIVGNEGRRVSGTWRVLSTKHEGENEHLVWPIDVNIWMGDDGDEHRWGQGIRAEDFSARVTDGVVELDPKSIRIDQRRIPVEEYLDDVKAVILAVAEAAAYQDEDPAAVPSLGVPGEEQKA